MKIDQDLRIAIRCAEKAQPDRGWQFRAKLEEDAINAFLAKHPKTKTAILHMVKARSAASKKYETINEQLCQRYGLRVDSGEKLGFACCDDARAAFVKAGGKLPGPAGERWRFESVMAQLAGADEKSGAAILRKLGINWNGSQPTRKAAK